VVLRQPGIQKGFISEAGVPALQLSFIVTGVPYEEAIDEDTNDKEMVQIGRFVLGLRKGKIFNQMQLGSSGTMDLNWAKILNDQEIWQKFLRLFQSCSKRFSSHPMTNQISR